MLKPPESKASYKTYLFCAHNDNGSLQSWDGTITRRSSTGYVTEAFEVANMGCPEDALIGYYHV